MDFDEDFFTALGVGNASDAQKAKLAGQIAETLQDRVAVRLSEVQTEEQLAELDRRIEQGEDKAQAYLAEAYPDYPLLVQDELERLKTELAHDIALAKDLAES